MISREQIEQIVAPKLEEINLFLVDIKITPSNSISVVVDSDSAVTIESCISVSRFIESSIDREKEDYELEVMSAGVGQPLRIARQYVKNIGRDVEVVARDGVKYKAKLIAADDTSFTISFAEKIIVEGKKRKQEVQREIRFLYDEVKTTKVTVSFK